MPTSSFSKQDFPTVFFVRYFLIIYYLYVMSINFLFPKKGIVGIIFNVILLIFVVYLSIRKRKFNYKFGYIYIYLFFVFLLVLFTSSNLSFSIREFVQFSIPMLCLPIGFNILSSNALFREFQWTGVIALLIYLFYIVIANIFNFGDNYGYRAEGALRIGNLFSDSLYLNVFVISSLPLLLYFFPDKKVFLYILTVLCAILVVVNMKRTAIAVLIIGPFIYYIFFLFSSRSNSLYSKTQLKSLLKFLLLLIVVTPFFYSFITTNYNYRKNNFIASSQDVSNEARVQEFMVISDEILTNENVGTLLFGKETFNLVGTYGHGQFANRQIHDDYAKLLNGTGVIGILVWFLIHFYILAWMTRMRSNQYSKSFILSQILFPLAIAFFAIFLLAMGSGIFGLILPASFFYAEIGGILRYFYNLPRSKYIS